MKRIMITLLGIGMAAATLMAKGDNHTLTVVIKNMRSADGVVTISLFDSESNWLENGKIQEVEIDNAAAVTVTFDVPAGNYAISAIHDENNNGELDTGAFGIPSEHYGFSNNARGMFGPASFKDSQFEVSGDIQIEITIK